MKSPHTIEVDDSIPVFLVDEVSSYSDYDIGIHYLCFFRVDDEGTRTHVRTIAMPIAAHRAGLFSAVARYSLHQDVPDTDWDDEDAPVN